MVDFVHLHVHSQYSILDGQASIKKMIDKAIADGMKGMALTDHGNMMGVKEFFDEISGRRGKAKKAIKADLETLSKIDDGTFAPAEGETRSVDEIRADLQKSIEKNKRIADFMPIFGCEMYVSRRNDMRLKDGRIDQSGWHLIVLAKNEQGYHNLIKLVSNSWIDGFYMRPRTDRSELERYHEGLIVCSACIGGEVPRKILDGNYEAAEEAIQWYHNLFGEDYYLELQRHEVKDPNQRANRETFPLQQTVNAKLIEYSKKFGIKLICSNDSHFVDEENAEAHDRLICLATGRDLDDPARMLYTKQEWFKTQQEMNEVFSDVPEALANTLEVLGKCEIYDIEHPPIMPFFAIPKEFGTEEEYRERITPEERSVVRGIYNDFFTRGMARQDSACIAEVIPDTMIRFCATPAARPNQILSFTREKMRPDVIGVHYLIDPDMRMRRETLEDGTLGLAVDFNLEETVSCADASVSSFHTYRVTSLMNAERKIVQMNIRP